MVNILPKIAQSCLVSQSFMFTEAMHLGDDVERHEADIVPVHRILRTGISEAYPKLHGQRFRRGRG